jgi:hypothetical protein
MPDWNHPLFGAATNLLNESPTPTTISALRIDIGLYGQYGEWTLSSRVDYDVLRGFITQKANNLV